MIPFTNKEELMEHAIDVEILIKELKKLPENAKISLMGWKYNNNETEFTNIRVDKVLGNYYAIY